MIEVKALKLNYYLAFGFILDWHYSKDLLRAVQGFHDKYARQPQAQIAEAKAGHTTTMGEIERQMRQLGMLVRLEYTGSSYEGTKVARSRDNCGLEFDVMAIIDSRGKGLQVEKMLTEAGFARLKVEATAGTSDLFGHFEGDYLNAQRTADKFFGQLQKCINNSQELSAAVTLRRHGPAAQMDVSRGGALFYSVDVVPTYEVNGERYVAKPITGDAMPDSLAWRRSYSIEAKEKILGADGNNGCRKKVFRILKVIRNREPVLAPLTSYHLKTALFLEMDNPGLIWSEDELGKRLMGVLYQLEIRLTEGNLPHYFLGSGVNLLSLVTKITIENMRDRVRRFRSNEIEMKRILSV